jgi:hypothetical protein
MAGRPAVGRLVAGLNYVLVDVVGGYVRVGFGYTVLMAAALAG